MGARELVLVPLRLERLVSREEVGARGLPLGVRKRSEEREELVARPLAVAPEVAARRGEKSSIAASRPISATLSARSRPVGIRSGTSRGIVAEGKRALLHLVRNRPGDGGRVRAVCRARGRHGGRRDNGGAGGVATIGGAGAGIGGVAADACTGFAILAGVAAAAFGDAFALAPAPPLPPPTSA